MCTCMCAGMWAYVRVWLLVCVLCHLCGLSQNIEFHGHLIPGAVSVACGTTTDDNADANHRYFVHFHIICI